MSHTYIPKVNLTDISAQAAFDAAMKNLVEINTIPCNFSVFNVTGLMDPEVPFMIRAGGSYENPWTRDSAINTWAAGRFILPQASKNTLLSVCTKDENGDPIILPDNQTWDRIVWAVGAWEYILATGDRKFLEDARGIVARGLAVLHAERYDEETGLYRGGSFFNDGISGYPKDIYEPNKDHSFMGEHPRTETILCLSTNCIYCEAWNILGKMNALLGIADPQPSQRRNALKEAILRVFWNEETRKCSYMRYPDGRMDHSQELAGISFGVLFGILPACALEDMAQEEYGIPSILPPFPGLFSKERPGRHNNLIWPFLNGFYIHAAANAGLTEIAGKELANFTRLVNSSDGIYEIYNPYDGSVNGGWQIGGDDLQGHLWDSCPDQTWSATSYIGAVLHGVFGIRVEENRISFIPCVPEYLEGSSIQDLTIRGKKFSIVLSGWGKDISAVEINGVPCDRAFISFEDAKDSNEIRISL